MVLELPQQIIRLRLAVGFLGESAQPPWWNSGFLARTAEAFLNPVFGRASGRAQYHGVTEAACRIHDDRIGVGRAFHLFRLPEAVEQRVFDALQPQHLSDEIAVCCQTVEGARSALTTIAVGSADIRPGPLRLGEFDSVQRENGIGMLAAHYLGGFTSDTQCFPYFTDRP